MGARVEDQMQITVSRLHVLAVLGVRDGDRTLKVRYLYSSTCTAEVDGPMTSRQMSDDDCS